MFFAADLVRSSDSTCVVSVSGRLVLGVAELGRREGGYRAVSLVFTGRLPGDAKPFHLREWSGLIGETDSIAKMFGA